MIRPPLCGRPPQSRRLPISDGRQGSPQWKPKADEQGKRPLRVLISAGPTREPIDPVRFLSNYSTGYLGNCLVNEALKRGHRVTLVSGPTAITPPQRATVVWVERAQEMHAALRRQMRTADVLIMAAAVCDFQPVTAQQKKLPRRGRLTLALNATPDVVGCLPRRRGQLIVGFALETAGPLAPARAKLRRKRLDVIVAQRINGTGSPFGARPVHAWLLDARGAVKRLGRISKPRLSRLLFDDIERRLKGASRHFPAA